MRAIFSFCLVLILATVANATTFQLSIYEILNHLRPGEQFRVSGNDKDYSEIIWGESGTPKPTAQEMLDVEFAAAKVWRKAKVDTEAQDRITAAYSLETQRYCAMGVYDAATTQAIQDGINAILADAVTAKAAIDAKVEPSSTVAEVIAFTW